MPAITDWFDLSYDHGFQGDDKAMLQKWYWDNDMSVCAIALKLGLSDRTIQNRMDFHNIKTRPQGHALTENGRCQPRGPRV